MREGYYEVEGNYVEYEGGDNGYDIDAGEDIPLEFIMMFGTYLHGLDEE